MEEFRAGEQPEQILGTDLVATFSWRAEKGQADHQEVLREGGGEGLTLLTHCTPTGTSNPSPDTPKAQDSTRHSQPGQPLYATHIRRPSVSVPCWSQGSDRARAELIRSTDWQHRTYFMLLFIYFERFYP